MAVGAPVYLSRNFSTTNKVSSNLFTPTAGTVLAVLAYCNSNTIQGCTLSITDTFGGLGWINTQSIGEYLTCAIFTALVPPGAPQGSATITGTAPSNPSDSNIIMTYLTGAQAGPGATGTAGGTNSGGPPPLTLSAAPSLTSQVVTYICAEIGTDPSLSHPTPYTQLLAEANYNTYFWDASAYASTTATTIQWNGFNNNTGAIVAAEITIPRYSDSVGILMA